MLFSHDTEHALTGVVDLVNTVSSAGDLLEDLADLQTFIGTHEAREVGAVDRTDLTAVRRLRGRLRAVFTADSDVDAAGS